MFNLKRHLGHNIVERFISFSCSFLLNSIADSVEASEGSSEYLVLSRVVDVGELELFNILCLNDLDSSLEGLGEHKILVEGFPKHVVIELLFLNVVVILSLSNSLCVGSAQLRDLVVGIDDFFIFGASSQGNLLALLFILQVELLAEEVNFSGLLRLELSEFSSLFVFLLLDLSDLKVSFLLDIFKFVLKILVKLSLRSVVFVSSSIQSDLLLFVELLELTCDLHLDHFGGPVDAFSVVSLEILEDRVGGYDDFSNLDTLEPDTPTITDFLHLFANHFTENDTVS